MSIYSYKDNCLTDRLSRSLIHQRTAKTAARSDRNFREYVAIIAEEIADSNFGNAPGKRRKKVNGVFTTSCLSRSPDWILNWSLLIYVAGEYL